MKEQLLFNPNGDDSLEKRRIIGGNSTNLFNMNNIKYTWTNAMYRKMMAGFWIPERISLEKDVLDYNTKLNDKEKEIYSSILSFLTFLDSIQTKNIPKVSDFITAPEVNRLLAIQDFFEVIHSASYSYIIDSIIPDKDRMKVYEMWRTNDVLYERNSYIAGIYQNFWDDSSQENFARVLVANYILESLYFYNGFIFFYNLSSRNLMLGTADLIRLINRDELDHIELFSNMIKTVNHENPNFITEKLVHEMYTFAAEEEIKWFNYILKDSDILGLTAENTEKYTKYIANKRVVELGFQPIFLDNNVNPYEYLELQSDSNSTGIKGNFFESKVTNYNMSESLSGWDDILIMENKI